MSGLILRSGYLVDFIALSENGQTLFETAIQIRETLRLQKQQALLECLAIPQYNNVEEKVDWYSPFEGKVTSWATASEQQRESAVIVLEKCLTTARELSQHYLSGNKVSGRLFGSMLTKLFQFPASQYIYLVGDKPVITFWGFLNLGHTARKDVFDCLRSKAKSTALAGMPPLASFPEEPETIEFHDPDPVIVTINQPHVLVTEPVLQNPTSQLSESVETQPQTDAIPVPVKKRAFVFKWHKGLKFFGVVTGLVILQIACSYLLPLYTSSVGTIPAKQTTPLPKKQEVQPSIQQHILPLKPATVSALPTTTSITSSVSGTVKSTEFPVNKNALVLPADEVKIGSTSFMDGHWKGNIQTSDPLTGKPPALHFRIKNSNGSLNFIRDNNVICKARIYLGLMQSGNLQIKSRSRAKCSDQTRPQLPEIVCKQGLTGAAQCTARYIDNTLVPMTLLKVSK